MNTPHTVVHVGWSPDYKSTPPLSQLKGLRPSDTTHCYPSLEVDTAPEQWRSQCIVARIQRDKALNENAELMAIIYEVSTGGYTPMQAHEWLKSHAENVNMLAPAGDKTPPTQENE